MQANYGGCDFSIGTLNPQLMKELQITCIENNEACDINTC